MDRDRNKEFKDMKRILVIVAAAVGALVLAKKSSDQQAERELWAEATDEVSHN